MSDETRKERKKCHSVFVLPRCDTHIDIDNKITIQSRCAPPSSNTWCEFAASTADAKHNKLVTHFLTPYFTTVTLFANMCLFLARSPGLVRKTIPAKCRLRIKMSLESPPTQVWKRYGSTESLSSSSSQNGSSVSVRRLSLTLRLAFGLALPVFFVASQRRQRAFLSEEQKERDPKGHQVHADSSSSCLDAEEQDRCAWKRTLRVFLSRFLYFKYT